MHDLPRVREQTNPRWFTLDNAAKMYPAIRRLNWASVFRIEAYLKEDANPNVLQKALEKTLPRFPTFSVIIRRGVFWYYLEHQNERPIVQPEPPFPCRAFKRDEGFLFRVLYYRNRVSLEVFHSLSDGTGALCFLKTLLRCYLNLMGRQIPVGEGALDTAERPHPEELEDAFIRFAEEKPSATRSEDTAFQLPGAKEPAPMLHITSGTFSVTQLSAAAKKYGASVTVFITALILQTIGQVQRAVEGVPTRPAKVSVPVNLRRWFSSRTMRNFSLYINCSLPPTVEEPSLEDIIARVRDEYEQGSDEKLLRSRFSLNVYSERNRLLRIAPLFLKKPALKTAYRIYGERLFTMSFSNMGRTTLPEGMADDIKRFGVVLNAGRTNRVNVAAVGFGDSMTITVSRSMRSSYFEKMLFRSLSEKGVSVFIESNWEGAEAW